jgi:hypothetical protein
MEPWPRRAEFLSAGEDLARLPENGWSLYGLAQSLRSQGKKADAVAVSAHFKEAWKYADVQVCHPRVGACPAKSKRKRPIAPAGARRRVSASRLQDGRVGPVSIVESL